MSAWSDTLRDGCTDCASGDSGESGESGESGTGAMAASDGKRAGDIATQRRAADARIMDDMWGKYWRACR